MLIAVVSSTGHEREPTFWFGIRESDALTNSIASGRLRLSDLIEADADLLSRTRAIDLRPQQPSHTTPLHGLFQTLASRVQVNPATRFGLPLVNHADAVAGDDPDQLGSGGATTAARTHPDRGRHLADARRRPCDVSHRKRNNERRPGTSARVSHRNGRNGCGGSYPQISSSPLLRARSPSQDHRHGHTHTRTDPLGHPPSLLAGRRPGGPDTASAAQMSSIAVGEGW